MIMKLLFTFILLSSVCYGQNRKDQIESLNKSIDSLNTVLSTTRDNSTKEIGSLNDKIKEVTDEVTALKSDLTNLQASNNKLSKENEKFKTDLEEMSKKNLELEATQKLINKITIEFDEYNWPQLKVMDNKNLEMLLNEYINTVVNLISYHSDKYDPIYGFEKIVKQKASELKIKTEGDEYCPHLLHLQLFRINEGYIILLDGLGCDRFEYFRNNSGELFVSNDDIINTKLSENHWLLNPNYAFSRFFDDPNGEH